MKFTDILSEYNIPIAPEGHHHCRSGWVQIDCPFCGKDSHKWHLGYSIEGGYFNCWCCGGHSVVNTIMEITGLPYNQVKKTLGNLEIEHFEKVKPTGKLVLPKGIVPLHYMPAHIKYLQSRGFDWQEIERIWQIQAIPLAHRLSWRIFIPIIYHSEMVSWTTRSISLNERITRYISTKENEESIPHHSLLYGEDFARHAIIVVEGCLDAWRIGPGAVGTFGTGYSLEQLERMARYPTRAICFDNEKEAQKRAKQLSNDLSAFPGDTYNVILDKKDAAEETKENIKKLRKEILE